MKVNFEDFYTDRNHVLNTVLCMLFYRNHTHSLPYLPKYDLATKLYKSTLI